MYFLNFKYYCFSPSAELYDTAKRMLSLGIPVTIETLRHYVLPALATQGQLDANGTIGGLKEAGVPVPLTVSGIVAFLLDTQKSVEAAALCKFLSLCVFT